MERRAKYLDINKKIAIIFAAWPLEYETESPLKKQLYSIYYRTVRLYFLIFVTTQWIQTYHTLYGNFQELMDNISVALDYTIGVVQLFTCMSNRAMGLIKKVVEIEEELLRENQEDVMEIHEKFCKKNDFLNKGFVAIGLFTVFLFFLMPAVELYTMGGQVKPLPFSSWFPFDKYRYYGLAYALQVIAGVYSCQFVVCTDLLFFAFMIFCIGQLRVLQVLLKNFKPRNDGDEKATMQVLRNYIQKHQTIIEFVEQLDYLMKYLMLLSFSVCSILLAAISSQIISAGFGPKQLKACQFLFAMLVQMMLFYWHANEIRFESLRVADAIWDSKWYECCPKAKRSLHIMMIRSQRALTLSVGPFYVMSTDTAIMIIKATYSYVTLLRQSEMRKQEI